MMQDGYNVMGVESKPMICTCAIKPDGDELNGHEPAYPNKIAKANAELIASAPELLAALERFTACKYEDKEALCSAHLFAQAAIAKAKGE